MEEVPINSLLSIFSGVELHFLSSDVVLSLFVVLLLLVSSAFISASEVAYFSLNATDLDEMDNKNVRELLKSPNELLATILITCN